MKIIVIGLGSMGKRRIRLLKKISGDIEIIGVDSNSERVEFVKKEYEISAYDSIAGAMDNNPDIECAVISTSPLSHAKIINECLNRGLHVFTEINLVDDMYDENMKLAEEKGKILFLSSTFLYRDEIKYISDAVENCSSKINYSYHIGQYLPDWHPWENFKDFFVGDKRTNGCREIFAIEMPWLTKAFGEIADMSVIKSKNSSLNIDYMDNYMVLLKHANGNKGMLAVDVVSRKAVRNLEIFSEDLHLFWDGSPTGLRQYDIEKKEERKIDLYETIDQMEGYSAFVIENAYQAELEAFVSEVQGNKCAKYSFEQDKEVLKIIDQIEG